MDQFSEAILGRLLADFTDRHLTANDLRDGCVGVNIASLKVLFCDEMSASPVDFDLALKDLEDGDSIQTGPMVPHDNPRNSSLVFVGLYSKNEYAYLTEKGYKAARKSYRTRPVQPFPVLPLPSPNRTESATPARLSGTPTSGLAAAYDLFLSYASETETTSRVHSTQR